MNDMHFNRVVLSINLMFRRRVEMELERVVDSFFGFRRFLFVEVDGVDLQLGVSIELEAFDSLGFEFG